MVDLISAGILNLAGYKRKSTLGVNVGNIALGGSNPIRLQTMTTTNTNNISRSVSQCIRAISVGAEYVRLTTQGVKEAQSLGIIKKELISQGYQTPIIADVHFNPSAAIEAAKYADKIRINPGNFSDKSRASKTAFSEVDYEQDLNRTEERFLELLKICKNNSVAIRIGVNHGSLSQRIMSRYGDTPLGMAQSAIEFLAICKKHNHHQVVVSMKSSNARVMVQANRQLVKMMNDMGFNYPIHLGVTEAGEGEDGRIKSSVGIGSLLIDGIGDTIRVSLTEEPEHEIPVAKELVKVFSNWQNLNVQIPKSIPINPFEYKRKKTFPLLKIGGENVPVVIADLDEVSLNNIEAWGWSYNLNTELWQAGENAADYIHIGKAKPTNIPNPKGLPLIGYNVECRHRLINANTLAEGKHLKDHNPFFIEIEDNMLDSTIINKISNYPSAIAILRGKNQYSFYSIRNFIFLLGSMGIKNPCIISFKFPNATPENFQVISSAIMGSFFIDGLGDGIMICAPGGISGKLTRSTAYGILQATRVRISKTEFISCPGCGRTLFNLNQTLQKVKERTSHLKGLKIGVMGCIVNGPGEMADADYGYVGSGPGHVTLYRKMEVIKKNVPESIAVEELVNLIKVSGDWFD